MKRESLIILIILLLALGLRLYHLDSPYLDHHSWRQTDTASIAKNFYANGFNILKPEVDWNGNSPGVIEVEFQITTFLTALLYLFLGVKDWVGRIITIIFSLLSVYFIFRLVKHHIDWKAGLFTAFALAVLPLNIFFSRVLMPEPGVMFFSIAALYYFSLYIDKKNDVNDSRLFILAILFATLTFLSKLPMLLLLVPLAITALKKYRLKIFSNKRMWIFFAVSIIVTLAFYFYMHQAADIKNIDYSGSDSGKWGSFQKWTNLEFYKTMLSRFETITFTIPGMILLVLGIISALIYHRKQYMFFGWLIAAIAYIFILAPANEIHSYYQMPLVSVSAVFIGIALYTIYEPDFFAYIISLGLKKNLKKVSKTLSVLICAVLLYFSVTNVLPLYGLYATSSYNAAIKLKSIDQAGMIISVPYRMDVMPELFYYSDHKGWVVRPNDLSISSIEYYRSQGVKYIIFTDAFYIEDVIQQYLVGKQSYAGEGFIIYKIV